MTHFAFRRPLEITPPAAGLAQGQRPGDLRVRLRRRHAGRGPAKRLASTFRRMLSPR